MMVAETVTDPVAAENGVDGAALAEVERLFRAQLKLAAAPPRGGSWPSITAAGSSSTSPRAMPTPSVATAVSHDTLFPLFSGTKPFASVALCSRSSAAGRSSTTRSPRTGRRSAKTARTASSPPCPLPSRRLSGNAGGTHAGALGRLGDGHWRHRGHAARPRPRHDQRLSPPDAALGLRRARAPPRWPGVRGLSARGDHRPARHGRHLRRSSRRLRASSRQTPCHRRDRRVGAGDSPDHAAAYPPSRDGARRQWRLHRPRHGPLLRGDRGGWGARRRAHPAAGDGRAHADGRGRRRDRSRPSMCRSAVGSGFELGGLADPRRHWPGATSTVRTFWHGGFGSSVCWGDADSGLAMAFLTNGVRRDEAGAIARRDLSDAVRAAFR